MLCGSFVCTSSRAIWSLELLHVDYRQSVTLGMSPANMYLANVISSPIFRGHRQYESWAMSGTIVGACGSDGKPIAMLFFVF